MKNKTRKDSRFESHYESMPLPSISNMDDIAVLTDDALLEQLRLLEIEKEKAQSNNIDSKPWETEIAYHRREVQLRRQRREEHDSYLKGLETEAAEAQRLENTYPVADLDNSSFMFFN